MSVPILTTLASDNFQRANVSPLTSPWELDAFSDLALAIESELCVPSVFGDGYQCGQFYSYPALPDDQFCSATITAAALQSTGGNVRLTLRVRNDNSSEFYAGPGYRLYCDLDPSGGGSWSLLKDKPGTVLLATGTTAYNAGDVLIIAAIGSTIYVLQNSTILAQVTDTDWPSSGGGGVLGLYSERGNSSLGLVSNFAVGSASLTPPAPPSGGPVFLGSVTEIETAPSGARNPFLGTFTVISSAPAGENNPYLGKIVVGSVPAGASNPSLGQIVVIGSAPAGARDAFLGTAASTE